MATTGSLLSIVNILAQQTKRTKGSSRTQIKQFIAESDSKATSLQNEIAALESQIASLIERRDRERAAGAALRYLIAPIRDLPAELLAEIFLLTMREGESHRQIHSLHIKDAFHVSHVCRHWRQTAIGLPRLWTGPVEVLFYEKLEDEEAEGYINCLQAWFARSEPFSIPIYISGLVKSHGPTEFSSRLKDELLRVASRMRSSRFENRACGLLFRPLIDSKWDSLEELYLPGVLSEEDSNFDLTTTLSFTTAPRLRKLSIDLDVEFPCHGPNSPISLSSRISHTISSWTSSPSAKMSSEHRFRLFVLTPPQTIVIVLDHLRVLTVRWFGGLAHGMPILDYLSAPALDDLRMSFQYSRSMQWAEASFAEFQRRSPNLIKLKITGNGAILPPGALRVLLQHAPSLTHLSVNNCADSIDDALLSALCYTDGSGVPLVPHLHSLTLAEIHGFVSQDGLAGMIASRWWTDAELASRSRAPTVARWRRIRLRANRDTTISRLVQSFETQWTICGKLASPLTWKIATHGGRKTRRDIFRLGLEIDNSFEEQA